MVKDRSKVNPSLFRHAGSRSETNNKTYKTKPFRNFLSLKFQSPFDFQTIKIVKMKTVIVIVTFLVAFVCAVKSSKVLPCENGKSIKDENEVTLSNCPKLPCKLKKRTTVTVEAKFKPETDIELMKANVNAKIVGIPFPFLGVDGSSVCDKIFDASTGAKAECPLKSGRDYVYKDSFKVLEIYPQISLRVHWALKNDEGEDVVCFEVPARITS